ncbi:MAG: AAA family ATPase [Pseudomonadota bacterium]
MKEKMTFYGRDEELDRLSAGLQCALSGRGQTLFVEGDAGSGKSALIEEFVRQAQQADESLLATLATCDSQTGQSDAYLPFIEILAQLTGDADEFQSEAISETNVGRLGAFVSVATKTIVEEAPDLLGSLIPGGSFIFNAARFSAEKAGWVDKLESARKQAKLEGTIDAERIFQLYTDLLIKFSESVPLVIIVDDLHWVDAASAQLLFHLSRRINHSRILLLGAFRPNDLQLGRNDERHPMAPILNELKRVHGDITLILGDEQEEERRGLVDSLIDTEANELGADFRNQFFQHTQGYPLFSQELLRTLKERGDLVKNDAEQWVVAREIDWSGIPPRVEGVIEERIARLSDDYQELLSIASVQGETFVAGVVSALLELPDRKVLRTLSRELGARHGLVHEVASSRVGGNQIALFRFSHNLFRQYLYHELGVGERMALHAEVGELLESLYEGREADVAPQLAYHFSTAEDWEKAIPYLIVAAKRQYSLGAYADALERLDVARLHVDNLSVDTRDATLLEILVASGGIHQALKGYTHPDVEDAFVKACALTSETLNPVLRAAALYGLWTLRLFNLELDAVDLIGRELETLGEAVDSDLVRMIGYRAIANAQYQLGNLDETVHYVNLVVEHYDPNRVRDYLLQLTYDPKVFSLGLKAWSLAWQGKRDEARATESEMFEWARALDHPASLCVAYLVALELNHSLGDHEAILSSATAMKSLAKEYRLIWYEAFADLFLHWLAALDTTNPDRELALEALTATYREAIAPDGNLLMHSQFSRMLAEALVTHERQQDALDVMQRALAVATEQGEGVYMKLMQTSVDTLSAA